MLHLTGQPPRAAESDRQFLQTRHDMPFNVRFAHHDAPRPRQRPQRRRSMLAESVGNLIQGALFACGVLFVLATALWLMSISGVLGDPLVIASWLK